MEHKAAPEDPNAVNSHYGVIKSLERLSSAEKRYPQSPYSTVSGPGSKYNSRPPTSHEMYNSMGAPPSSQHMNLRPDSIERLGDHLKIHSPIRRTEYDQSIGRSEMYSPEYKTSPLTSSPLKSNQAATTLASVSTQINSSSPFRQ